MNRYLNILLPGIFLPTCLGTVYNFSQYSANLAALFEMSKFSTDIGFTLIIFFLGMCAAIFGRQVELNPKKMAIVSTIVFAIGMFGLYGATALGFIPLYFLACCLVGAGTGIGYVCPIKQLMSNFEDHKGLASGLAITGFGLGKVLAAPAIEYLLITVTLPHLFLILGAVYLAIMLLNTWLFRPNPIYVSTIHTAVPLKTMVKHLFFTKEYLSVWFMFCINISCGLALISQEKGLLLGFGFTEIAILMSLTAVFNILGRFLMSTLSDKIGRKAAYHYICSFGILASFLVFTGNPILALIGILMIEFAYGGNFSCLPSLLAKRFGSSCVSTVHAMTLSGWGIAGIIGPVLANVFTGNTLYLVLGGLYLLGFTLMEIFVKRDDA
jgi:OFA family oxalate/formate antiporter-like MFS transporter